MLERGGLQLSLQNKSKKRLRELYNLKAGTDQYGNNRNSEKYIVITTHPGPPA